MLGKYLSATGCALVCSVAFWAGCSDASTDIPAPPADAGGSSSSGGNGDSGNSGDSSTSKDSGSDTGASSGAPEVTFTYGACPAKTPCGGDPKGTWKYTEGGCAAELAFAQCAGVVLKKSSIKARGIITIGASSFERNVEATTAATVEIPAKCVMGQPCNFAPIILMAQPPNGPGFDTATCKDAATAGACECEVSKTLTDKSTTTYTVAGNTITTGDGKSYDFCVEDNNTKMTYRDKFQNLVDANFVMKK